MNSINLRSANSNGSGWILGLLILVMAATRFHHEGTAFVLPDASLAVFFLAGLLLRDSRVFIILLILAFLIDSVAITAMGVSGYCVSPAYVFMAPTYAVMWGAGRWLQLNAIGDSWQVHPLKLVGALALSTTVAFIISNASFYWFSGKVPAVDVAAYFTSLMNDFPMYLGASLVYALVGVGLNVFVRSVVGFRQRQLNSH